MAKIIQIQAPLRGLNQVDPFTGFDANFATDVLNVRPYEMGSGRQAIGQRGGTGKWASLVSGTGAVRVIQQIGFVTAGEQTAKICLVNDDDFLTWDWASGYVAPTGGSGAVNSTGVVCCQPAFSKVYISDGTHFKVYNPATETVANAVASAGTLPSGYKFTCLFQGRLFHFLKDADPGNWFASKLGDPLDYDTATGLTTSAVVGNNSNAGTLAEPMTAAVPWADNWLVMASANQLHVLRGSPKTGSRDLITDQVGIVGPRAWCQLPSGAIVFVSQHGLYSLAAGGQPQPISSGRVRSFFDAIDFSTVTIQVVWNLVDQCVYVAAVPADTSANVNVLVWNVRNDSFWIDQFPASQGPNAMGAILFKGDRLLLLGGRDGFLRSIKPFLYDDDGVTITSRVRFAPIMLGNGNSIGRITKARFNWSTEIPNAHFAATYKYYVGSQPGQVAAATSAEHSRDVLLGTYQSLDRQRVRGGAIAIEINSQSKGGVNCAWGFESGLIEVTPAGRMRETVGPDADLSAYGQDDFGGEYNVGEYLK